jgi:hypothetical protein
MTNPALSTVHVNTPLTNISVAYSQAADKFVAHRVFPVVPVAKQSDRYYEYDKDDWLRSEAQLRAPGSESAGAGYRLTNTSTYFCAVNAVHKDVDDQIRANADPVINMDRDATEYITQQLLMKREKDWASTFFATSTWTGGVGGVDITPSPLWDASSTPITDIALQAASIMKKTGYYPNTLVIPPDVYNALINNDDIVDRIKYTQKGVVGRDLLANVLGLDRVEVCWATNNTANEGATASMDFINGTKDALLCYSAPAPSLLKPSAGYTFTWSGYTGAQDGMRISRFRMDHLKADRVEGELAYAQKLIGADLGVYFNNVIA